MTTIVEATRYEGVGASTNGEARNSIRPVEIGDPVDPVGRYTHRNRDAGDAHIDKRNAVIVETCNNGIRAGAHSKARNAVRASEFGETIDAVKGRAHRHWKAGVAHVYNLNAIRQIASNDGVGAGSGDECGYGPSTFASKWKSKKEAPCLSMFLGWGTQHCAACARLR